MKSLRFGFIVLILVGFTSFSWGQRAHNKMRYKENSSTMFKGLPNLLNYDNKLLHFGFLIGYNQFNFSVKPYSDLSALDSVMSVTTVPLSGFDLAIITDLRLGKFFNLRFIPGLSFGDRIVEYTLDYGGELLATNKRIETIYLNMPLLIKFKSTRMHNVRIYALGGAQYTFDLVSNQKKSAKRNSEDIVKIQKHDVQAIAGFGFDFYMERFKFSTEFKMSFGLRDVLVRENNPYAQSIQSLNSKVIMISFLFE